MTDINLSDPWSGTEQTFHHLDDGTFSLKQTQDVESVLDANKSEHLYTNGYSPSRELKHLARVPIGIAYEWIMKYGVNILNPDHKPAVRRLLDSNEYRYLRTSAGNLGTRKASRAPLIVG